MRGPLVAATFLVLLALPMASAQAPDPAAAVGLACAAVGGPAPDVRDALPVCPRDEPAAPAAPGGGETVEAHEHGAPSAEPASDAQELADEAGHAVEGIGEDPASAPGRLVGLVAAVRQFVEDLLQLPGAGMDLAADNLALFHDALELGASGMRAGGHAVLDGARTTFASVDDAAKSAFESGRAFIRGLFVPDAAEAPALPRQDDARKDSIEKARGLLDGVLEVAASART